MLLLLVDCEWSDFSEWTQCTRECGTGWQSRKRTEETLAQNGGADCQGRAQEVQNCNTHRCPGT